jgi:hypothetical protein
MTHPFEHESTALPREEALAFARVHKRHFGTAIGVAAALVVSGLTLIDVVAGRAATSQLYLLTQYFSGYTVSWSGVLIGGLWAFFVGWVGGWFLAFSRNFVLAATVFWVRAKTNLQASQDFLDHI